MNSQPVSKLTDYNKIAKQVKDGNPINLTKNGKDYLVLITKDDYEQFQKALELQKEKEAKEAALDILIDELTAGTASYEKNGGRSEAQIRKALGL